MLNLEFCFTFLNRALESTLGDCAHFCVGNCCQKYHNAVPGFILFVRFFLYAFLWLLLFDLHTIPIFVCSRQ